MGNPTMKKTPAATAANDTGLALRFVVEDTAVDLVVDPDAPLATAGRAAVARCVPPLPCIPDGPLPDLGRRGLEDDWFLHTLTGARLDAAKSARAYGLDPHTTVLVVRALDVR
jgi:hypothetical protein